MSDGERYLKMLIRLHPGASPEGPGEPPGETPEHGDLWQRAGELARRRGHEFALERVAAPARYAELTLLAPLARHRAHRHPRFRTRALCELLLREAQDGGQPWASAEEHVELVLQLAAHLEVERYGAQAIAELQARAWALRGELQRQHGHLPDADLAFARAAELLGRSGGDPLVQAAVGELQASLRRDQQRWAEADSLLDRAATTYGRTGEPHLAARVLCRRATLQQLQGQSQQAIVLLRRGLARIEADAEPHLELCARHQLIRLLAETGELREACSLLEASRADYLRVPDPATQLLLHWLEGCLALGCNRLEEAEAALVAVREGYWQQGAAYQAMLVAVDLAELFARQQRTRDLERLAEQMLLSGYSQALSQEACRALQLFRQAVQHGQVTRALLHQLGHYLRCSHLVVPETPS